MPKLYKLKGGFKVEERQLFERTYPVLNCDELYTATYFIFDGKVYAVDSDTGKAEPCNFSAAFLNTKYRHSFCPLDKTYEGEVPGDE